MTQKQIEQNARAYARLDNGKDFDIPQYRAYIVGAHSRDKEIKEWIESKEKLRRRLMHIIHDLRHPWIDVKDELPFEGQSVLVKMDNGNHATCNYIHDEFVFSLILEADKINVNTTIKLNNVIQWMEIPN